ncbi:MAG: carbonic anhydrase [Polyangiales bacterium]
MTTFRARSSFEATHPDALAMYCSDGRFTESVEELLRELGFPRLDTLTLPGGPGLVELTSAPSAAIETARQALTFLIKGHRISRVVLIAHEGCGYYKSRFAYDSPDYSLRRQLADLRAAERWVQREHQGVTASSYFARVEDGHVVFEPVAPEE